MPIDAAGVYEDRFNNAAIKQSVTQSLKTHLCRAVGLYRQTQFTRDPREP